MKSQFRNLSLSSLTLCAILGGVVQGHSQITSLFPNGDFDSPAGARGTWVEAGGGTTWSYPTTGGNPNGYGVMNGAGGWGIWVGGNTTPLPIAPMGLVAGETYTFVQDMKTIVSGSGLAGVKIESWGPGGQISNSGDMRAPTESAVWETYYFPYTIAAGATGLKVVPLWAPGGTVGYDNIGVIVPPQPVVASILSPADYVTVSSITFTIKATASVSPGTVTNVAFYDGATLLANDPTYPYSYTYNGASVGDHTLTVVARDNNGNSAVSAEVHVNVEFVQPPPLTYPTNNAPTPIWPAANVISVYNGGGTYTSISPVNFYPWGATASRGDYQIIGGDVVTSYLGLGYAGVEVNPSYNQATALDITKMTTMHLDVWTTANQMAIKLVSTVNGAEPLLIYDAASGVITSNHWVSLDIPLSVFTNLNPQLNLAKIDQLLWVDNGDIPGPGVQNGDFYIDNVFFYNNTPLIQSPALTGTDFTCQVASQTGVNYVLQGTPSLTSATWPGLQTKAGTGRMLTFTIPTAGNPQRFFRIRAE